MEIRRASSGPWHTRRTVRATRYRRYWEVRSSKTNQAPSGAPSSLSRQGLERSTGRETLQQTTATGNLADGEIEDALRNRGGKAPGPDGMTLEIIQKAYQALAIEGTLHMRPAPQVVNIFSDCQAAIEGSQTLQTAPDNTASYVHTRPPVSSNTQRSQSTGSQATPIGRP